MLINSVSIYMYNSMGLSNQLIGLSSIIMLPWVLKMFWAPIVDLFFTKRSWIVFCQCALAIGFFAVAGCIPLYHFFIVTLVLFFINAFISATHDIAADGYYLLALDKKDQAFFVGIRSTFYRLAMVFSSGVIVVVAGWLEKKFHNIPLSWSLVYIFSASLFFIVFIYHRFMLPIAQLDFSENKTKHSFLDIFVSYFKQKKIIAILFFILFYRLGEANLAKMAVVFLLDEKSAGGLGLATQTVGFAHGTFGQISLIVGGILGGLLISKFGLKKCIWPMALALNVPNLGYLYLALVKPGIHLVYIIVVLEQFGYGLGFTAFMVFLMYITKEQYKTSHYAISTGFMALGMMIPGMFSGYLQSALGYAHFFILVLIFTLPGFVALLFIPLDDNGKNQAK